MEASGLQILGFIDQFSEDGHIAGKPVWRIADAPKIHEVIISIPRQAIPHTRNIKLDLIEAGFEQVLDFDQAIKRYPDMPRHLAHHKLLWMHPNRSVMLNESALRRISNLLRDAKSREVLASLIRFRRSLHGSDYPEPDGETEYFPNDVPWQPNEDLSFVDGGAWTGDTIEHLLHKCKETGIGVKWIAAFEPDRKNRELLANTIYKLKHTGSEPYLFVWPCALWSQNRILQFSCEGNSASHVIDGHDGHSESTFAVALDTVLSGAEPNYIKLDIEGAELPALQGAKLLIEKCRPNLAICLYHRPQDLWQIPLWIAEHWPSYDFHLRLHGPMGLSTVLYCTHSEKKNCAC